ncbi:hypothetical protein RCG67_15760 [Kocuria sp. CPCC 205292]|uniref:hypothetical protein n=1 Tax=Kocuria cellulosilytica TaxID=3071451 RepID=UPI0034D49C2D
MTNQRQSMPGSKFGYPLRAVTSHKRTGTLIATGLGLLTSIFIDFGARVSIAEFLLLGYLLLQIINRKRIPATVVPYFFCLTLLLLGFIAANAAYGFGGDSILRTTGGYGIFILSIVALAHFLKDDIPGRLAPIMLGSALGEILGFYVSPTPEILIDPWKFGLGNALTVIVILALTHRSIISSSQFVMPLILISLASLHFIMGSRSLAGILMLSVLLVLIRRSKSRFTNYQMIGCFALISATVFGVVKIYSYYAQTGLLGEDSATKYSDQNGEFGVLPGARKEIILLAAAWIRSPIFGWGPTAAVDSRHMGEVYNWYVLHGYTINLSDFNRLFVVDSLPLHSIFLGLLVQAGLFAIPLIISLLHPWVRALSYGISSKNLLATFVILSGGVHLFVSPLGDTTRFPVAISLAVGLAAFPCAKRGIARGKQLAGSGPHSHGAV